ncbi:MAG: DUF2492 family protein [Holophagaceae bacterium]|nr:DUF2492 family protein [Holophagaceae bacterium]
MDDGTQNVSEQGIYGHEVLNLLVGFGGTTTVEALRHASTDAFGTDAVFCNCHGGRFDFDQLMEFFSTRGKVEIEGQIVRLGGAQPCSGH